ncbi:MAG: 4-hydroxy-2-oxovalerate aldolase [Acidobacteria bacterium]|nr:4-hydroxy-2-oxovalerate aldolase [Acidobacteriota bacterium]
MDNLPTILDVTLRDGSYAVDFQFTADDTRNICGELDEAGFALIEVGHGVGLGASSVAGLGKAAETDEAYLKAASESVRRAKWGMFCIPGIARLEDVDLAADHGMGFIRIGTNVTAVEKSEPFIARAKRHGMQVHANLMKSYTLEPKEFAKKAKLSQSFGSDLVCIVDSAGGMVPGEVEQYFGEVRAVSDVPLGFHGHNNLQLAVANSMRAAELGAVAVDTSLRGFGRSAGNTPTEVFLAAMERAGRPLGFDLLRVIDLGERLIKPLMTDHRYDSMDVVVGFAQFHSSFAPLVHECAAKYGVDERRLIMAVCARDKVNPSRELVEEVAAGLCVEDPIVADAARAANMVWSS